MYNAMDKKSAFQFVNWMEALQMFGVHEVTINDLNIDMTNGFAKSIFNYYTNKHILKVEQFRTIRNRKRVKTLYGNIEDDIEVLNMYLNKCLYDNRERYWYTLVNDIDELMVPQGKSINPTRQRFVIFTSFRRNLSTSFFVPILSPGVILSDVILRRRFAISNPQRTCSE